MTPPTDHELLLLQQRDIARLQESEREQNEQLRRGAETFARVALIHQEYGAALADLRQNYSRAMLAADEAREKLHDQEIRQSVYSRLYLPLTALATALLTALAEHYLPRIFP